MSNNEAAKINLAALRKVDSSITSIVDSANQVALYKFVSGASKWEKTDIEGTLFVYMRSEKPQHGLMVMNRLSTTNLVEPITEELDFQDQTPFLLYRNGKGNIHGVWFYEKKNCLKIYKLLKSLSQLPFTKPDKSNRQRSLSESNRKKTAQMDIISLLSKAQDEYDKKSKGHPQNPSNVVKPMPVRLNGNSEPLSLGMLFSRAAHREDSQKKNGESAETILQNLLANSTHTLQHIEADPVSVASLEKDLKEKLHILPPAATECSRVATAAAAPRSDPIDIPMLTPAMLESHSAGSFIDRKSNLLASPTQLLSPMDFAVPSRKKNTSSFSPEPTFPNGHDEPQCLKNSQITVTPLNREQFKEAMIHMIQTDEDFVINLHECYVRSLKSQLNSFS